MASQSIKQEKIMTLLSEKRTVLSEFRTGITTLILPLSIITLLVATSKYYNIREIPYMFASLIVVCIILFFIGGYLTIKPMPRLREIDKKLKKTGEYV